MDAAKNFAKGTLSGTLEDGVTSLTLVTGQGARFPAAPFNAVIWNSTDYSDPSDDPNVEILRVTAKSGDVFTTIVRGQEGTGDNPHDVGGKTYTVIAPLTAKVINDDIGLTIARILDSGGVMQIGGGASVVELNSNTGTAVVGDINSAGNNTAFLVDDGNQLIRLGAGTVLAPFIPDTDPSVEGALYYDSGTGVVKRSAG